MKKEIRSMLISLLLLVAANAGAQDKFLLTPSRVFDGEIMHEGWSVLVQASKILAVGPTSGFKTDNSTTIIKYDGSTLMPGMIEGHSHLLLHPYNEVSWNDQVMKESDAERVIRATVHARNTLLAGFTTVRDLGSEGAGYSDVALKNMIDQAIIVGPRMLVAGRAIVATGSYGPFGYDSDITIILGAEPADGNDLIRVVRDQIGRGADVVKVYADYRYGSPKKTSPTFSVDELKLIVETARSSGHPVVAHASTEEGMRRAILAGVETIEHGDGGTAEIFKLMKDHNVALCPTLAAGDAVAQYNGWKKGIEPEPDRIKAKRQSFAEALKSGVTICAGGDVGVFTHGDNVRELEMMVDYGIKPDAVLKSVTSVNAKVFHQEKFIGRIAEGLLADIIIVDGNPSTKISDLRNVRLVMRDGIIYRKD
jgi:imidazolonepropionase-like amidohydrolase